MKQAISVTKGLYENSLGEYVRIRYQGKLVEPASNDAEFQPRPLFSQHIQLSSFIVPRSCDYPADTWYTCQSVCFIKFKFSLVV